MHGHSKSRTMVRVTLFMVLIVEVILWKLWDYVGWDGMGRLATLAVCGAIILLPLIVATLTLIAGRGRFGVRTLLIVTACVAVFVSMSAIPYARFNHDRRVTRWLHENTILFSTDMPTSHESIDWWSVWLLKHEPIDEVPFWLRPFVNQTYLGPKDDQVQSLACSSRSDVEFVLSLSGAPLRNVQHIYFYGVNDDSDVDQILSLVQRFPRLESVRFANMETDRIKAIVRESKIRHVYLDYFDRNGNTTAQLIGLDTIENVESICVSIDYATDEELGIISRCKAVKFLKAVFPSASEEAWEQFRFNAPRCDVDREWPTVCL